MIYQVPAWKKFIPYTSHIHNSQEFTIVNTVIEKYGTIIIQTI